MIRLVELNKSYGNKILFTDLNYHFPQGKKIALVGENGCGKSTLIKILSDAEQANSGDIVKPKDLKLGYLEQHLGSLQESVIEDCLQGNKTLWSLRSQLQETTKKLESDSSSELLEQFEKIESTYNSLGGYSYASEAEKLLSGLGFSKKDLTKNPQKLSGGWKMRLALAKMLLAKPDFIILDEPTNHLDLPSLVWFENYIKTFDGTVLLVSHDRDFLNRFTEVTLCLKNKNLYTYKGNYDFFLAQSKLEQENIASTRDNLLKKRKQLQEFVDRFGSKASKASQAQSKLKEINKINQEIGGLHSDRKTKSMGIVSFDIPKIEKNVCTLSECSIGYKDPILENIEFSILKQQKIAIIGSNGIGKSTLIKTLAQQNPLLSGTMNWSPSAKIGYFSQTLLEQFDPESSILECLLSNTQIGDKQARGVLGALLFSGDDCFKKLKVLSGGELNRVGLAYVFSQKPNVLLLDEPTNHLDMQSYEALVAMLQKFSGTLVFVSHNRNFINRLASHMVAFSKDKKNFSCEGNLDDYERLSLAAGYTNIIHENLLEEKSAKSKQSDFHKKKQQKRKKDQKLKKIQQTEHSLKAIEEKINNLEHKLNSPQIAENYYEATKIQEDLNTLHKKKQDIEELWILLQEELDP
jgi:ATP-binding cassette, subfamily F, member 3